MVIGYVVPIQPSSDPGPAGEKMPSAEHRLGSMCAIEVVTRMVVMIREHMSSGVKDFVIKNDERMLPLVPSGAQRMELLSFIILVEASV